VDDPGLRFRVTELRGRLAAIESLEATLRSGGDMYLMGFDAAGDGKAIVAIGNPDTAAHTAVYVPGTGAGLSGIGEDVGRMRSLWLAAQQLKPVGQVSAVTWVGYDAPDTLSHAMSTSYADRAAPDFTRFLQGVTLAQGVNTNHHVTAIGHSYGSVVLGQADHQSGGLTAQDLIVAGSPGMHVANAKDLNGSPDHVWVAAAKDDIVTSLGSGVHAPIVDTQGRPTRVTPDDRGFGANRFTTDGSVGHSDYWSTDNPTSLNNQAAVVVGSYDDVRLVWGTSP